MDAENNNPQAANANDGRTTNSYIGPNTNDYKSFWDIHSRQYREMWYHYANTTDNTVGTRLVFEVTPYIGLAYSDGEASDGVFFDVTDTNVLPYNFYGSPTQYGNMYANGYEMGNFVPAKPITLSGMATPNWGNAELKVFSSDHCHVIGANIQPNIPVPNYYNPNLVFFDISSPSAPYQPTTVMEEDLLSKYGKVFFYYWEAKDPVSNLLIDSGYIMADCDTSTTDWADTTVPASNLPGVGSARLYENMNCLDNGFRSYELVIEKGTYPAEYSFTNPLNGRSYRVSIETFRGGYGNPNPNMGGTVSTVKLEVI